METEDEYDEYETETDLAKEFGSGTTKAKIAATEAIEHAKEAVKGKADEVVGGIKERIDYEKGYRTYKASQKKKDKMPDYATRYQHEQEMAAKSAAKRAERRKAIKHTIKTTAKAGLEKYKKAITENKVRARTPPKKAREPVGFDLFGGSQGFSLFDTHKKGKQTISATPRGFDFGIGSGKPQTFSIFGNRKKGKKRKTEFSLW